MSLWPAHKGRLGGVRDMTWHAHQRPWQIFGQGIVHMALWWLAFESATYVFAAGPWQLLLLLVVSATFLPALLARSLSPQHPLVASIIGIVVAILVLGAHLHSRGAIDAWWQNPQEQIDLARSALLHGQPPMAISGSLEELLTAAVFLLVWMCVLLHVGAEMPLFAALFPSVLLLLTPAVTAQRVDLWIVVSAAVLWLALFVLDRPILRSPSRKERSTRGSHLFRCVTLLSIRSGVALLTLAASTLVLVFLPATMDTTWNRTGVVPSPVDSSIPDVTVSLGQQLRRGSAAEAFRFAGVEAGTSLRFTLATLRDLDHGRWQPVDVYSDDLLPITPPRGTPPFDGREDTDTLTTQGSDEDANIVASFAPAVTIHIKGLVSPWLPVLQSTVAVGPAQQPVGNASPPALDESPMNETGEDTVPPVGNLPPEERLDLDAREWAWVPRTGTVRSSTRLTRRGLTYTVWGWNQQWPNFNSDMFGKDGLLSPDAPYAPPVEDLAEMERYRKLPEDVPLVLVRTAQDITGPYGTDMAKAYALQEWFTNGQFVYDENAPWTPGANPDDPYDTMAALLERKHGYCVHFASAFVVMARSAGIPSRVAVGYAARAGEGEWTSVLGRDLHAWPEIHVPGVGWVAYEPTPGGAGRRADTGRTEEAAPGGQEEQQSSQSQSSRDEADTPASSRGVGPSGGNEVSQESGVTQGEAPRSYGCLSGGGACSSLSLVGFIGAGGVLVVLLPRMLRVYGRARRARALRRGDIGAAWDEVVASAIDVGALPCRGRSFVGPMAQTPEAICEFLQASGALGSEAEVCKATEDMCAAVDAHMWAPPRQVRTVDGAGDRGGPHGVESAGRARDALVASLQAHATTRARLRGGWMPRSVIHRFSSCFRS